MERRPVLEEMPASRILTETGGSLREVRYWKSNKFLPTGKRYSRVISSCARSSREKLEELHVPYVPVEDIRAIKLYAEFLKNPQNGE